jgi:DNA-binding winged helix-turn-helix (wHTH) protein/TolB-like protein/tetratricopeptide (TPR) repeat protein
MHRKTKGFYEFGPFVLDTSQHLLSRDGKPVPLTPKTYDLLVVLVENSGRLLAKDELMKALWPDSFVEESNLTQQISMARKALGESQGKDRYIITVPGRGYRFAAAVKEAPDQQTDLAEESSQPEVQSEPRGGDTKHVTHTTLVIAGIGLLTVGIVVLAYSAYRKQSVGGHSSLSPRRLAILPFENLRKDANDDYLGFSLADEIITKLDSISSLTVRPSSAIEKYRNQIIDIRKASADLHVDTLLTGNFIRDGEDLRITSQLIDVNTENILWKGTIDLKYDRLLTVHDSVAQEIIKGLKVSLSPLEAERLKPGQPVEPAAYEYYLRGVDLYAQNDFRTAITMFQKSAEIDSSYALTWAHLGRAHTADASFELGGREEYGAAQAAYERALSVRPDLIDAQIYMANLFTDTGRVEGAVPLVRNALKTNPNHAEAHWELGYAYRFAGMLHESVEECERARQLDPGVKLSTSTLNAYLYLGQYDKFLQSLPKDNVSALIIFYRGLGEFYKKNALESARYFDQAFELHPSLLQARIGKAISYAIGREPLKGIDILRDIESKISERGVGDPEAVYKIAQAYAALNDKSSALRVLAQSIENGFFSYPYFAADPLLNSLRKEGELVRLLMLARERHEAFKKKFFGQTAH